MSGDPVIMVAIGATAVLLMCTMAMLAFVLEALHRLATRPQPYITVTSPPINMPQVSWLDQQQATALQQIAGSLNLIQYQQHARAAERDA